MANDGEFQEQIRQLGKLLTQFDQLPAGPAKTAGKELVQLLMDVHGAGLERMMEIVFESMNTTPGSAIEKLGQDSMTGSLLLLYSLHPEDLETRVQKAVDRLRPRLRKLSCAIELVEIRDGSVQLRLAVAGHGCGSSTKDLQALVEEGVYEFAPDVTSLDILGLETPAAVGFVALESLLGHSVAAVSASRGSDGAD
jgi:Fe-S cluster biogenesis protein NfuA